MILVQNLRQQLNGNKSNHYISSTCTNNMKSRYFVFSVFTLMLSLQVAGQNKNAWEDQYKQGKEFLKLEKYGLAMQTFKPLTSEFENNIDVRYASYFYAVASWHNGEVISAKNMFLQLKNKYSSWNKIDEINLWLIKIYFDEGQFNRAKELMHNLRAPDLNEKALELEASYLSQLSYDELYKMITSNTNDKEIAIALANKIEQKPIHEQDRALLENIISVFELDPDRYHTNSIEPSIHKDTYHIAVLLPFLYDDLITPQSHITNRFVIDLYDGMKKGNQALKQKGISLILHAYDTKKDASATSEILALPELKHMDLIIGPLWLEPVKLVDEFSFRNRINMINPLSSNNEIFDKNPYALLFSPSNETMGRKTAEFIADNITSNKNYFVFYGDNKKDSTMASSYIKKMDENGFQLCYIEKIRTDEAKTILDILTNTVTIELDENEYDTLVKYDTNMKGTLKITEKDMLVLPPDSIGHIFIASDKAQLAANTITALQTRGDHITLIGKNQWLNNREISLEPLEQLNTHLIAPSFIDKKNSAYTTMVETSLKTHHVLPGKSFWTGYDMISIIGQLLYNFGNHFQNEKGAYRFIKGTFSPGFILDGYNNNQYVPLVKLEDGELVNVNPIP